MEHYWQTGKLNSASYRVLHGGKEMHFLDVRLPAQIVMRIDRARRDLLFVHGRNPVLPGMLGKLVLQQRDQFLGVVDAFKQAIEARVRADIGDVGHPAEAAPLLF